MPKLKALPTALAFLCCLFEACSPKPANVEKRVDALPSAKPGFHFGNISISPNSGRGRDATFQVAVSSGAQKPAFLGLLINDSQHGERGCYVLQSLADSESMLVADSGIGSTPLGSHDSITNHQCELIRK